MAVFLSGCLSGAPPNEALSESASETAEPEPLCPHCDDSLNHRYGKNLNFSPVVINTTTGGDKLVVRYEYRPRCNVPDYAPTYTLLQYSRDRLMQEVVVEAPPESDPVNHSFPLYGPAPHMIVVESSGCANYRVYATNLVEAWNLMDGAYAQPSGRWTVNHTIDVEVPVGKLRGHAVFKQMPNDFSLAWVMLLEQNGAQDGVLTVVDGTGATIQTQTWTPFEEGIGHSDYQRRPGDIHLYLNLTAPATTDTAWKMQFRYRTMIPEVCDHGFRLEGLCR